MNEDFMIMLIRVLICIAFGVGEITENGAVIYETF